MPNRFGNCGLALCCPSLDSARRQVHIPHFCVRQIYLFHRGAIQKCSVEVDLSHLSFGKGCLFQMKGSVKHTFDASGLSHRQTSPQRPARPRHTSTDNPCAGDHTEPDLKSASSTIEPLHQCETNTLARSRARYVTRRASNNEKPCPPPHEVTEQVPVNTNFSHRTPSVPHTPHEIDRRKYPHGCTCHPVCTVLGWGYPYFAVPNFVNGGFGIPPRGVNSCDQNVAEIRKSNF